SGWSNIQIYLLLILPVIIGFDIIIFQKKKYQAIRILPLPILLLLILFLFFPIEKWMTRLHYPNQEWVDEAYGHSGHSLLTRSAGQLSFYQNGILMESYGDPLKNEELVHFNMLQRDTCDYVLIIGGALLHLQHEIDKYPIKGADYLEADHSVINMGERNQLLPKGKNVRVIRTSVLPFLRHTQRKYGSVLINLPGPLSISLDRFYERSFFIRLKKVMTVEGVVTFVLPGTANYLSESAVETISSVQNTIQEIFRHVLLLPGESTYLLASDQSLKSNISEQYVLKGIQNTYVNNDYFSPIVFLPRVKWLNNISKPDNNLNTINHPKAFGNQLVWWFNRWNMSWAFLVLLVIIPFIAGIAYMRGPFRPGMFSAGFISTGSEILLLFAVQMITGNLYLLMGLMSALFMGGLALGSFLPLRFLSGRRYLTLYILLGVITLIPALLAWGTSHLDLVTDPEIWTLSMIMICQILIAWITGTYYRFGSMGHQEHESGGLFYGLDLYGAAAGSLVIPLILFPRFGIAGSFLALSAFGFVTLMIETALKGRFVSSP
ncbi:MAG: hypothetical protein J7L89_01735, partial [Bacteroidales bacterium]|nr:hypothetical protein [Bacteroidales bacterium]